MSLSKTLIIIGFYKVGGGDFFGVRTQGGGKSLKSIQVRTRGRGSEKAVLVRTHFMDGPQLNVCTNAKGR